MPEPLVVVALAAEAKYLEGVRVVLTGPGKVAAASWIFPIVWWPSTRALISRWTVPWSWWVVTPSATRGSTPCGYRDTIAA